MTAVGRPKKKARKTPGPKLEVLKVGSCLRDAIKKARDIMTAAEVAEYLQIGLTTLYKLVRARQIPAFKVGTDHRFHRDAIEKLMIDRQVKLPSLSH